MAALCQHESWSITVPCRIWLIVRAQNEVLILVKYQLNSNEMDACAYYDVYEWFASPRILLIYYIVQNASMIFTATSWVQTLTAAILRIFLNRSFHWRISATVYRIWLECINLLCVSSIIFSFTLKVLSCWMVFAPHLQYIY